MIPRIPVTVLEKASDILSEAIDSAGPEKETLFLAKLALALSACVGDPELLTTIVDAALADL